MKKVLVVIRDRNDRSRIRQNCGWDNVVTTASAHKAQRIIADNGMFHLIVIEQQAIGMAGSEFLTKLKEERSYFGHIIIAKDERQRTKLIEKGFREECVIIAEAGNSQLIERINSSLN